MTRTILDINILQTVPPSNLNRDDTGSPKSAVYGGVRRARVSSQAWKRATRLAFENTLDASSLGTRTKRVVELLGKRITAIASEITAQQAEELAKAAFAVAGIKLTAPRKSTPEAPLPDESGYLLFLSAQQLDHLARLCIDAKDAADPKSALKDAGAKKALSGADGANSVDLALFGRMVADSSDLNVDAACQVAHAISVHRVDTEFDYFTAVDDHKNADTDAEDAGAGMIGTVEFNSSTLYRYATVDVDLLNRNLGDTDATQKAVEAFVTAFATSMPTGKQNTFANRTLPDAVIVSIRDTQSVNLVGAFEEAVAAEPRLKTAAEKLATHARSIDAAYDTTPVKTWVVSVGSATAALEDLGDAVSMKAAVSSVGALIAERLASSAADS